MIFSVIIPTYNDWERLEKCVITLLDCTMKSDDYEIIIVDNANIHNPPEKITEIQRIRLIHEKKPGSYAARNAGARVATGRYLAFTDSDCLPDKRWLENARLLFEEQQCDLIGGRIDLFRVENSSDWAYIYEKYTAFPQSRNVPKGHSVTANLLIRREAFEQLEGFNSGIKSGGDWEFSRRAVEAGFRLVYGDNVIVKHPARDTVSAIFKKQKRFSAWGFLNVKRDFGHSGVRILLSNTYHGISAVFRRSSIPENRYDKMVVFTISAGLYFYKTLLQVFILLKIFDPEKIRE